MAYSSDDEDDYGGGFSDDDWNPNPNPIPPKKEVLCLCKQCRESALGKFDVCHPREYYTRRENIEKKILAEYTERNGHLAEGDPIRHPCGNGAMDKRRYLILEYKGFCVHVPNPSKPMPYMTTDGGVAYAFSRPLRPGEIRNNEAFHNSFKTADGMTVSDYRRLIDDYSLHHEMFDTESAAFPHHHALAMASMSSTCATLETVSSIPIHLSMRKNMVFERAFLFALKRAQNPFEITRFTQMSGLQKNMIFAHSGIAGLVISRLFSTQTVQNRKQRVTLSHEVVRRVHSKTECEIFADNRYGKSGAAELVAAMDDSLTLETATDELRLLYTEHIQNIMRMVHQLKRGRLNADDIRAVPAFQRMHRLWLYCLQEVIAEYEEEIQYIDGHHCRNMIHVSRMVGEFPLLCSSEMMAIYSKNSATFAKNAIYMLIRMASNGTGLGCRAGFLAFAAVEPRMVDQFLAPRLELCGWDGYRYEAIENHIPSRCSIFGNLRKKYQVHLPRTGDYEWEICRKKGGR